MTFFDGVVIRHPVLIILFAVSAMAFLSIQATRFRLDASAETLVLENDEDLRYARQVESRFGEGDSLLVAFTPNEDLFSDKALEHLHALREDLKLAGSVESVTTILDVPLLASPPVPLKELDSSARTLESPDTDRELARKEFRDSPLYRDLLVSADLRTTALILTFPDDRVYKDLLHRRNALTEKKAAGSVTAEERKELRRVSEEFRQCHDQFRRTRHHDILAIRAVIARHQGEGALFLGGVSMIADDMITFVKSDLRVFGTSVFMLLIGALVVLFRKTAWVVLPTLICLVSVVSMIGFLGWVGWEVTVISSNFISLQLIITLAMSIHLIMRYREIAAEHPEASQKDLVVRTIRAILRPCVYSGLTTIGGFASLIFCDIRPVISFGWIMVVGVAISMIVPLLLLPAILVLMPRERGVVVHDQSRWALTAVLGRFTAAHGLVIVVATVAVAVLSGIGISKLQVENCFISYFRESTEIHRGMKAIDQQLGGTTPLDVVIDFDSPRVAVRAVEANAPAAGDSTFDQFGEFEDASQQKKYWFTRDKINQITAVHDYLDGLPETGKVLSLATLVRMIEPLNEGKPLDGLELALLFDRVPESIRRMLVRPYASVEHNQARVSVRILDSEPSLKRNELLARIKRDLTDKAKVGVKPGHVRLAGMLVLYNNMLQNLYVSQVVTLGLAGLMLFGTYAILFQSLRLALIASFPNSLAVACMLGVMGWLGLPLDMMTITIAAIGVGLADDDTIHYIHRFGHEFETHGSYLRALYRSHASIGNAIYYTTVTLVIGFSILTLSKFIPSIYFGLLTVFAITVALFASLTLLPQLLILLKAFGKEGAPAKGPEEASP